MTRTELTPWCATEQPEELVEYQDAQTPRHAAGATMSGMLGGLARGGGAPLPNVRFSVRWAGVPMAAAAAWAIWARTSPTGFAAAWPTSGVLFYCAAALILLALSHRAQRNHIAAMSRAMHRATQSNRDQLEVISPEDACSDLAPLQRELMSHLDRIADAIKHEHDKGVELGRRVAEREAANMRAALDTLSDAVIVSDAFERVVATNAAARRMLGHNTATPLRRPIVDAVADRTIADQIRQSAKAPIQSTRTFEHLIEDRAMQFSLTRVGIGAEDGQPADSDATFVVITVARDVTRQKEASQVTTSFVSHVAHELRTPLSSLKAYVEMLVDGEAADEDTRAEYYNIIQVETDRMSRLIDEILNISRIESGRVKASKKPVAFAMIVRDVLDVMKPQAAIKKMDLREELAPVMHVINADRDMIYESVMNLVSNAVKYTPEGGRISVRMSVNEADQTITTSVTDTGVGIPEEDLPRMFEKFFRVKANNKMAKGTGLGLNLVRNIVETVHGGRVGLVSNVGEGSTFSITLPLHQNGE